MHTQAETYNYETNLTQGQYESSKAYNDMDKSEDQSLKDQETFLKAKLAQLQHQDDMSAMQIDEMEQKNARLMQMIADKQNLKNMEKQVEEEEKLSQSVHSRMNSEGAKTDNQ